MKMFRKFVSALLVCAMALTLLTACGSSSSSSSSDSKDLVTEINAQLKAKGSSITVTADSDLNKDAKKVAAFFKQYAESEEGQGWSTLEAQMNEVAGSDKYIMLSESGDISSLAAEFAELIVQYDKDGKTAKSIGFASGTIIGDYDGIFSSAYIFTAAVISYK